MTDVNAIEHPDGQNATMVTGPNVVQSANKLHASSARERDRADYTLAFTCRGAALASAG